MQSTTSAVKGTQEYSFKAVEIEINHDCNRTCAYCPNSMTERKHQGRMTESLFRQILGELKQLNYQGRISYHFYNEPLLSPDLDKFVLLTKEYLPQCRIEIFTNGTLLNEARLLDLITRGVDKFTVTKHHSTKEYPFEDLLKTLSPEVRDKIKFQHYKDLILTSRGGLLGIGYKEEKPPLNLPCFIPSMVLIVTVNGNVVPCYEDYNEENFMGNLKDKSLMEIWHSDKYRQFRKDLQQRKRDAYPVCRSCNCRMIIM
ncbi:MAG: radical SAM/SPASM domain-containing protein [Bdellovibrio sp.]